MACELGILLALSMPCVYPGSESFVGSEESFVNALKNLFYDAWKLLLILFLGIKLVSSSKKKVNFLATSDDQEASGIQFHNIHTCIRYE